MASLFPGEAMRRLARRVFVGVVVFAGVAFAALAGLIASRDLGAIQRDVIATIERETGSTLTVRSARQVLWPRPHIVLDDASIALKDGTASLRVPSATIHIDLVDMLDGRIDGPSLTLNNPEIRLVTGPLARLHQSPRSVTGLLDAISGVFDGRPGLSSLRVEMRRARLLLIETAEKAPDLVLDPIDLRMKYNARRGRVDVFARRTSDIRPLELTFSLPTRQGLGTRNRASASILASGFGSRASFVGEASSTPDLALSGKLDVTIQDTLEQALGIGADNARSRDDSLLHLAASLTLNPRGANLEALKITRGAGTLTGIAALRENGGRWGISSTLAGDLVDGSATQAAIGRLTQTDGAWSPRPLDVNPTPALDLDIRLSTRTFRLGRITLENAALSVFTRAGRAEFAIAEARHGEGTIKARAIVTQRGDGQDLKFLVSGEKISSATFLDGAFGFSRLSGPGSFVFQAESHGRTTAEIARNLAGTGTLEIRNGDITGVDINRLMARSGEMRPEAALLASLGGRSPFEHLGLNVAIRNGRIEPVGASLRAARFEGSLDGSIDLSNQRHHLWVILKRRQDIPDTGAEFFALRIDGPLFSPSLKPDPTLLLKRS